MNIYISGISGTGMGPLALMAKAAGFNVYGSDLEKSTIYDELEKAGIEVSIGAQDGEFLKSKLSSGIDWFCYTSALPEDHPELLAAKSAGIKCTKRDELINFLIQKLGLKLVAVAGTHGKTTTTSMIVWAALKLGLPVAYIVGTTLGFAKSGAYHLGDQYFVYEADEYDRNFLKFHPWLAVIPSIAYDHPDIYPTPEDYQKAFNQFKSQSELVIESGFKSDQFKLAGAVRRKDASLAAAAIKKMAPSLEDSKIIEALNNFPGVSRRFEKLTDGLYTDYAHHPDEIKATLDIAKDEAKLQGKKGIIAIYEPHQNSRQHQIRAGYKDAFIGADKLFWLPTFLTREDSNLKVITPTEFIEDLTNKSLAEPAELNQELLKEIQNYLNDNYLAILMSAGPAGVWLRKNFDPKNL